MKNRNIPYLYIAVTVLLAAILSVLISLKFEEEKPPVQASLFPEKKSVGVRVEEKEKPLILISFFTEKESVIKSNLYYIDPESGSIVDKKEKITGNNFNSTVLLNPDGELTYCVLKDSKDPHTPLIKLIKQGRIKGELLKHSDSQINVRNAEISDSEQTIMLQRLTPPMLGEAGYFIYRKDPQITKSSSNYSLIFELAGDRFHDIFPSRAYLSPDGNRFIYLGDPDQYKKRKQKSDISAVVYDVSKNKIERVIKKRDIESSSLVFSPLGNSIAFIEKNRLNVLDLNSGANRVFDVTVEPVEYDEENYIAWHKNGIIITRKNKIIYVPHGSKNETTLSFTLPDEMKLSGMANVSDDGKRIIVLSEKSGSYYLNFFDAETKKMTSMKIDIPINKNIENGTMNCFWYRKNSVIRLKNGYPAFLDPFIKHLIFRGLRCGPPRK